MKTNLPFLDMLIIALFTPKRKELKPRMKFTQKAIQSSYYPPMSKYRTKLWLDEIEFNANPANSGNNQ